MSQQAVLRVLWLQISKKSSGSSNRKRVSNKNLLLIMFENGFAFGKRPSKSMVASEAAGIPLIHFELGYSNADNHPEQLTIENFSEGFSAIIDSPTNEFSLFDERATNLSTSIRIGRAAAFRHHVLRIFDNQCCVCNGSLVDLSGSYETEAAHIVPKRLAGCDDVRNGLALCRQHHWAFDRGMFGIGDDYRILVPDGISSIPENASLAERRGNLIAGRISSNSSPHPSALSWHRNHILCR